MSGISPVSTPISTGSTGSAGLLQTSQRTRAAAPAEETSFAARVAQLGPTLGTVVATGELVSDAAQATYTIATQKLHELGDAAQTALHLTEDTLSELGSAASEALQGAEQAIEDAAQNTAASVSSAAQALAQAFDESVNKVGQWIDEAV